MKFPLIIGLGSDHGDDQAGWLVVDRLHEQGCPQDKLVRLSHPAGLLDALNWESELQGQEVIICDACIGDGQSGSIHRLHWTADGLAPLVSAADGPSPTSAIAERKCHQIPLRRSASHDVSPFDLLELAVNFGWTPASVMIWTVEGMSWNPGTAPSAAIRTAARQIADEIWRELQDA